MASKHKLSGEGKFAGKRQKKVMYLSQKVNEFDWLATDASAFAVGMNHPSDFPSNTTTILISSSFHHQTSIKTHSSVYCPAIYLF